MSDDFDKATAEAVRTFAFIAAGVLAALLAMFLWGAGHRILEEYDHWSCARTCGAFGVEKVGGYADCECQTKAAREQVEDALRLEEAKSLMDKQIEQVGKLREQVDKLQQARP